MRLELCQGFGLERLADLVKQVRRESLQHPMCPQHIAQRTYKPTDTHSDWVTTTCKSCSSNATRRKLIDQQCDGSCCRSLVDIMCSMPTGFSPAHQQAFFWCANCCECSIGCVVKMVVWSVARRVHLAVQHACRPTCIHHFQLGKNALSHLIQEWPRVMNHVGVC